MNGKPVILILIGCLWPGNDSAGPSISIRSLCQALAHRYDFRLVARDRAFGADAPCVENSGWHDLGFAQIHYLTPGRFGSEGLVRLLRETPHDLLILNGFFDRDFTLPALVSRRLGRGSGAPVMLSPRGEFTGGALALKGGRKAMFRTLARVMGLHNGVHFHVTSDAEQADVRAAMPGQPVTLVTNVRAVPPQPPFVPRAAGAPLRLAFLGRISPVKGLDTALAAIRVADRPVDFSIYGPIADSDHWAKCRAIIDAMPVNVRVTHHGEIANDDTLAMLAAQDALLLPSLSENFGHAIFESLAAGTPVIIGDQTPWRGLAAAHAGFDLPVGDVDAFAGAIRTLAALPAGDAAPWRAGARQKLVEFVGTDAAADAMACLLDGLIAGMARL
ncbi:MAG: hypothetical protein RLZZ58_2180 [Pseudomonadota bacterium]